MNAGAGTIRPLAPPDLVAGLLESAPARVRRKLDARPTLGADWPWEAADDQPLTIRAGTETVTLNAPGGVLTEARCTCLLAPRCLHVLAVVTLLDFANEDQTSDTNAAPTTTAAATTEAATTEASRPDDRLTTTPQQHDAAHRCWRAGAALLATGARAADGLTQAELLRAAHAARAAGLHGLATAMVRIVGHLRAAAANADDFVTADLAADLANSLAVARRLVNGRATVVDVGIARRSYSPIGRRTLHGLCTEAVLTRSGYAGAVTHLLAGDTSGTAVTAHPFPGRQILTSGDVMPGGLERAIDAYRSPIRLGSVPLRHSDLSRSTVLVEECTASEDGRLGGGAGVHAVRTGSAGWEHPSVSALWGVPLAEQLASGGPLFLEILLRGGDQGGVLADGPDGALVRLVPATDEPGLAYRHNLSVLARAGQLPARVIGRPVPGRPRAIAVLAAGPMPGRAGWTLPEAWHGRVNLGYDTLAAAYLNGVPPDRAPSAGALLTPPPDPLEVIRRRLYRMVLGGRATLGPHSSIDADTARLRRSAMPTAAELLTALAATALETRRDVLGQRIPPPPDSLAEHWTNAMRYLEVASAALDRSGWLPST